MATDPSKKFFSLAPAIFTPFGGLPIPSDNDGEPSREQKLVKIMVNLDAQQEKVRNNMISILRAEADTLTKKAEDELKILDHGNLEDEESDDEELKARKRDQEKSVEEMLKNIRAPMKEGAKASDYELPLEKGKLQWPEHPSSVSGQSSSGEDVEMSGMDNGKKRTARVIKEELAIALKKLVNDGTAEMERYDIHAQETCKFYKDALERERARFGDSTSKKADNVSPISGPGSVGGAGGILKNKNSNIRVDQEALRRMDSEKDKEQQRATRDPAWVVPRLR